MKLYNTYVNFRGPVDLINTHYRDQDFNWGVTFYGCLLGNFKNLVCIKRFSPNFETL